MVEEWRKKMSISSMRKCSSSMKKRETKKKGELARSSLRK
jgi:hypothetical protein